MEALKFKQDLLIKFKLTSDNQDLNQEWKQRAQKIIKQDKILLLP